MTDAPVTRSIDHRNNCCLVAARELSQRSEEEVAAAFLVSGWRPGEGCRETVWHPAMALLGLRANWGLTAHGATTLRQFTREQGRSGDWILVLGTKSRRASHMIVVRDGRVVDPNMRRLGMRRQVQGAYRVAGAVPAPVGTRLRYAKQPARCAAYGRFLALYRHLELVGPRTPDQVVADGVATRRDVRRWLRRGVFALVE